MLNIYGPTAGQGQQVYEGERVADLNAAQTGALETSQGLLNWINPENGIPLYGETGTALQGVLSGQSGAQPITPEQSDEYFNRTIKDPAIQGYSQYTKPLLEEQYAGPGYWSSARAGAVQRSAQDLGNTLTQQKAGLDWNVLQQNQAIEQQKVANALTASGQAMNYGQMPTQEAANRASVAQGIYGMGSQEQAQRQAELDTNLQKFIEQNRLSDPESIAILMSLLGMNYSTTNMQQGSTGWRIF